MYICEFFNQILTIYNKKGGRRRLKINGISDFFDHGYFNITGGFIFYILIIIFILPFNGFFYFSKDKIKLIIYCILLIFVILLYYIFSHFYMSCDGWEKGLNNTYIQNDENKYGCEIPFPKFCPFKIYSPFIDLTRWLKIDCKDKNKYARNNLLKLSKSPSINKNTKRFGFPLTNNASECLLLSPIDNNRFFEYIRENLIDMDNKEVLSKLKKEEIPEVVVDFSKDEFGEFKINLNYNEELSKERKKLEKNSIPYSNNIIVIYLDSVSRPSSIRKLKKTLNFFDQFMSYKGKTDINNVENFHGFQFFKYYSHIFHTFHNYPRLYYGNPSGKGIIRLSKYLKENGFMTGYANDFCYRDNTNTLHNMTIEEAYDHQMIICDPSKVHYNRKTIKCLYGKMDIEYLFNYGNQFWRQYKNNRKFLNIISNNAHEGSLEVLKYLDDIVFNFLNSLYQENLFKETSIFLLSDHGCEMPSLYYLNTFYKIEAYLPMLYMIINDRKNSTYNEQYGNLNINQQKFITAYDIYNTINHIAYGDKYFNISSIPFSSPKSKLGESLFMEIDGKRHPNMYIEMSNRSCIQYLNHSKNLSIKL